MCWAAKSWDVVEMYYFCLLTSLPFILDGDCEQNDPGKEGDWRGSFECQFPKQKVLESCTLVPRAPLIPVFPEAWSVSLSFFYSRLNGPKVRSTL